MIEKCSVELDRKMHNVTLEMVPNRELDPGRLIHRSDHRDLEAIGGRSTLRPAGNHYAKVR